MEKREEGRPGSQKREREEERERRGRKKKIKREGEKGGWWLPSFSGLLPKTAVLNLWVMTPLGVK